MVHPTALYFPYIHIRDDTWLKYAALYWPRLARFCPPGYLLLDSSVTQVLRDELDWIRDLNPGSAVRDVAQPFCELVETHEFELCNRLMVTDIEPRKTNVPWSNRQAAADTVGNSDRWHRRAGSRAGADDSSPFAYIHHSQVSPDLTQKLIEVGLADIARGRHHEWVGMPTELASVYMCALAEQAAKHNQLHPVTDQLLPHAALSDWDVERIAEVLLGGTLTGMKAPAARDDELSTYVSMAVETVVPDNLSDVPIEKIIQLRKRYQAELDEFRDYVTQEVEQLASLRSIEDAQTRLDYLHDEVQRGVQRRLDELRAQVRGAGLEPVRALGHLKMALPPGVAAAVAGMLHTNPGAVAVSAGSAVVAASLIQLPGQIRRKRRDVVRSCPVGYLLHVGKELKPSNLVKRVHRAIMGS